jgi:hypothetical protein
LHATQPHLTLPPVQLPDYAGAGARLDPARGLALDANRWAWQPKVDGVYCQISTDAAGRIWSVVSRTGAELPEGRDLHGIVAAPPLSVLVGELEAHTESGVRAAAARGYRLAHLFDAIRMAGRLVTGLPYHERRGCLYRAASWVESEGLARDRSLTVDANGDAHGPDGRYRRAIPRDLRRLPIVPMARGTAAARELWSTYVDRGGGEGLVAVRLDAPLGARGSKRKIKATDTIDAVVVASGGGAIRVASRGLAWTMSGSAPVGAVVEVAHDGWYESGAQPRFARLVRRRADVTVVA